MSLPADDRLMLQRRLAGDARKWRTVVRFRADQADRVQAAAEALADVEAVEWRVVAGVQVVVEWRAGAWVRP